MLGGKTWRWILLFQKYDLEVVMKPRRLNMGLYHLLCIETGEEPTSFEEGLPDAQLFVVCVVDGHFKDINQFITTRTMLEGYSV